MSSPEAGPSSIPAPPPPLFKKRAKSTTASRISTAVIHDDQLSQSSTASLDTQHPPEQAETEELSVHDLIALRSLARKPTGIELQRLNKGEKKRKPKQSPQPQDKWEQQMKHGGLVPTSAAADDDDESDADDDSKPRRLVRKNNFQGETGTVDVDKHMMAYIEHEMAKRTGNAAAASTGDAEVRKALSDPHDQLYALAEKYRQLQRSIQPDQTQEQREGNVAFSSAMLSSIPEVDLGIDSRMKNIQSTEEAKRKLASQKEVHGPHEDAAYANARFQHAKPRANTDSASRTGGERKQMATDQLVLDRFKKRQKNFR